MKNKKFSILLMILGVLLLLIGIVLMVMGTDEKDGNKDNDVKDEVSKKDDEDNCKYVYSKSDNFNFEFKCDSISIEIDNLLFKFDKNEDSTYNLNILNNNQIIYNSKDNNVVMYTNEQAGNTTITNINDLYFIHSYAIGQCGNKGHLVVVSSTGELIKTFNGIFELDKENNNIYVSELTNEECGNVEGADRLYDLYNISSSKLVKVGSGYKFNGDTIVNDGDLSFVYGTENNDLYLNILYNGNNIFSSNGMKIYGEDQAGSTILYKIDDVYLINTFAAHQCGFKGNLIVVNANGQVLGTYDSLNLKIEYDNKKVTFIEDKNNECTNIEENNLEEVVYYINGNSFNK